MARHFVPAHDVPEAWHDGHWIEAPSPARSHWRRQHHVGAHWHDHHWLGPEPPLTAQAYSHWHIRHHVGAHWHDHHWIGPEPPLSVVPETPIVVVGRRVDGLRRITGEIHDYLLFPIEYDGRGDVAGPSRGRVRIGRVELAVRGLGSVVDGVHGHAAVALGPPEQRGAGSVRRSVRARDRDVMEVIGVWR